MGKYKIGDFQVGDEVHHLSNTRRKMVAIQIHKPENEILCRWVDDNGKTQSELFMPEELGKEDDLEITITQGFMRL